MMCRNSILYPVLLFFCLLTANPVVGQQDIMPAQHDRLYIAGPDTICRATVYRYHIGNNTPGQTVSWSIEGGVIAEQNPTDTVTVSFSPKHSSFGLKALVTDESGNTIASITKKPSLPSVHPRIQKAGGITAEAAASTTGTYSVRCAAEAFQWEIIPCGAGNILNNGNAVATILWNEPEQAETVRLKATVSVCGFTYSDTLDIRLVPTLKKLTKTHAPCKAPDAAFHFADGSCIESAVAFHANTLDAGSEYYWEMEGIRNYNPEPQFAFAREGMHLVQLTVTDKNGCTASSSQYVTITGNNLGGNITAVQASAFAPALLRYTDMRTDLRDATFEWMKGNARIAITDRPEMTVTESGDYWVKVTTKNGCIRNIFPPLQVIIANSGFRTLPRH